MKGIINTLAETKKKNFGEKKQVYVKSGGYEWKFVCLKNNMVSLVEEKIFFGPYQVIFDNIKAENIAILKLAYVGGFNYVCSITPNKSVLV